MSFKNKVVLVTGASSGIGAAIAVAFAKEGADVAMVGRNETKLAEIEQKCLGEGKPPLVIKADVTNDDDAKRIIQTTLDKFGKLDVLINNAGITPKASIADGRLLKAFDEVIAVNLRAPVHLTILASPYLIKTKGNIINISGVGGINPNLVPNILSQSTAKAGLNNFTLGSALELSAHGVRVNVISPGPVKTNILDNTDHPITFDDMKKMVALNRIAEPEEIADLALFLASDKAKGITGSNFISDNGMLIKH